MTEPWEKAFDFASDATKQLILLATGITALTVTFLTDVLTTVPAQTKLLLDIAWIMYFVSIVGGVITLLALAGTLGTRERGGPEAKEEAKKKKGTNPQKPVDATPSVYEIQVRIPSFAQVLTFLAALILTIVFAIQAL